MPIATIVIPMFQSAATAADTVRSVLADDAAGENEVIVVNDGSTDRGPAIVAEIARNDPRVRLISRENGGLAAARNTGILHARGEYLRFLDADDWALPGGTRRLIEAAERGGSGAACGTFELRDDLGRPVRRSVPPRTGPDRAVGLDQLLAGNAMGVGTVLLRRDVIAEDRFDGRMWGCEDWDLWLRLAARDGTGAVRFAAVLEPAVKAYRLRSGSMSKSFARMLRTALEVQRNGFQRALGVASINTSQPRRERASEDCALAYASMAAACGDLADATSLLDLSPTAHGRCWTAAELGSAGVWGVLQGLGEDAAGTAHGQCPPWVAHLDEFWHTLTDRGRPDEPRPDAIWGKFSAAAVSADSVADRITQDLLTESTAAASLWGMGRNGRLLAARLLDRGIRVQGRDARWADGAAPPREFGELTGTGTDAGFIPQPLDAPVEPGTSIVITPECDAGLVAHLPPSDGVRRAIRWMDVADRLTIEIRANLAPAIRACRAERSVKS